MIKRNQEGYEWEEQLAGVEISQEKLKKILNSKAPGPDGVQTFWVKNFTSLLENLLWHLNACLEGETLQWIVKKEQYLYRKKGHVSL